VPPNFQRFLPLLLIVFLLLIVVPALTHHGSSSKGPSASTLSQETIAATGLVDKAEVAFKTAHRSYSEHLADLLVLEHGIGAALSDGVVVQLSVSTNGQTYLAQVASSVIGLVRSRTGPKVTTKGCVVFKSGSGVACPTPPTSTTTTTTTGTSSTSTHAG
jgi:hypothetical protein